MKRKIIGKLSQNFVYVCFDNSVYDDALKIAIKLSGKRLHNKKLYVTV